MLATRYTMYHSIVLLTSILCVMCSTAIAQDSTDSRFTWFNAGIGASSLEKSGDRAALSAGATMSFQRGEHLVSIRFVDNELLFANPWGIVFGAAPKKIVVWDLGVLYGRIARATFGFASIGGGIAFVGGDESAFGIPLEAQIFWTPSSSFGIGLYVFANFNRVRSFAGALACVQF